MNYYGRRNPYWENIRQYLMMGVCGHKTSKSFARKHGGMCKKCATGAAVKHDFRDPGEVRMGA